MNSYNLSEGRALLNSYSILTPDTKSKNSFSIIRCLYPFVELIFYGK